MYQLIRVFHEHLFRIRAIVPARGPRPVLPSVLLRAQWPSGRHPIETRVSGVAPLLLSRQAT